MNFSKAVLSVILCAAPALAWAGQKATMDVPFPFSVKGRVLPAGTYVVISPNANGIASVENELGKKKLFFLTSPGAFDASGKAYATFQPTAKGYILTEVLMPGENTGQKIPGARTSAKPVQIALMGR